MTFLPAQVLGRSPLGQIVLAPSPGPMETNMSVNGGMTNSTDRAPTPLPMGANMSVNGGMTNTTDRAPSRMPMEELRKASGRMGVWKVFARECVRRNYKGC